MECLTYDEFVAVRLNDAFVRTRRKVDTVEAVRVALGTATMPRDWIDLLTDDERERTLWATNELLRSRRAE